MTVRRSRTPVEASTTPRTADTGQAADHADSSSTASVSTRITEPITTTHETARRTPQGATTNTEHPQARQHTHHTEGQTHQYTDRPCPEPRGGQLTQQQRGPPFHTPARESITQSAPCGVATAMTQPTPALLERYEGCGGQACGQIERDVV